MYLAVLKEKQTNTTTLNQYARNAENVQILHRYQNITGILCVQFDIEYVRNKEISINFNINVSHMTIHFTNNK